MTSAVSYQVLILPEPILSFRVFTVACAHLKKSATEGTCYRVTEIEQPSVKDV